MIAILAFGSLIDEPGSELLPLIRARRAVTTPFLVEYARLSKSRGMAPTLVPVDSGGASVVATLLILDPAVSLSEAKDLLFRRETRQEGSGNTYSEDERPGPNKLLVRAADPFPGSEGIDSVVYVDFPPEGKLKNPTAEFLAEKAIASVIAERSASDGVSYLIETRAAGVVTPLTQAYEDALLTRRGTATLTEALEVLAQPVMLRRLWIRNYKAFEQFEIEFKRGLNLLVGDNEVGKSTVLEAINLALTRRLNGRGVEQELTPHLFNRRTIDAYVASLRNAIPAGLPSIEIELYFDDADELAPLRGTMNHAKEDCCGIRLEVCFDEDYAEEYAALVKDRRPEIDTVPAEYYRVHWQSFAGNAITSRSLAVGVSYIDATTIRLQSGTDFYIQDIIRSDLDVKERVALNLAYRRLKETFSGEAAIQSINKKLTDRKGAITDKDLAIAIDTSQRTNWETNLVPHLDKLPFQLVGKGEQNALKIILALQRKAGAADVILVEEPENHLSFSSMTRLLARMQEKCVGKQIIVTTHSTYVLNKLGLGNLILLGSGGAVSSLVKLSPDTQEYFEKLSGYDTLRLVLAKKAILVEGPSDELVVQKAYLVVHGRLPIDDGLDVISVRGLSFLRFLEIAQGLQKEVRVVTDNDGDFARVDAKYSPYAATPTISIHRSNDNSAPTLEPQLLKANGRDALNVLFGTRHPTDDALLAYMKENKTDCALRVFKGVTIGFPQYILDAVR